MTRVYLFADFGKAPGLYLLAGGNYGMNPRQAKRVSAADRWWLVECENAAAGRILIEWYEAGEPHDTKPGRILDSGVNP